MKQDFIDNELLFNLSKSGHYLHLVYIYVDIYIHRYINVDNCAEVA